RGAMAPDELPHPVAATRRRREYRLVRQISLEILRERRRRAVPALTILVERAQHDVVEIPPQRSRERRRIARAIGRDPFLVRRGQRGEAGAWRRRVLIDLL